MAISPPTITSALYLAFTVTHLYTTTVHFPETPNKPHTPFLPTSRTSFHLLKILPGLAFFLSTAPIVFPSATHPPKPTSVLQPLAQLFLLASLALHAWVLLNVSRGEMRAAFARTTPSRVVMQGPYVFVRHPAYVAYVLGWAGTLFAVCAGVKPEAMARAYEGADGGTIGWRVVGLMFAVAFMVGLYVKAAAVEEGQFLRDRGVAEGERVVPKVRADYEGYRRFVRGKFVPGLI